MRHAAVALAVLAVTGPAAMRAQVQSLQMEEMTWSEIQAAIEGGADTAVITVGATEQHGPHLALASDAVTGDYLGPAVARALGRALVAPNIRVGVSNHHMMFPGTIAVRPRIVADLLREYVHSLAWHGFRHIVVLPTHGSNFETVGRMARELAPLYPHLNVIGFSDAQGYIDTLQATSRRLGIPLPLVGSHAGLGETAMILAIRPELVRPAAAAQGFMGDAYGVGERMTRDGAQAISPIGVLGDPRGATAEAGRAYLEDLAKYLAASVDAARRAWRPAALTSLPYGGLPDPSGPLAEGVRLRRAGRYAEARSFFERRSREDAGAAGPHIEVARTLVLDGHARRALEPLLTAADDGVRRQAHDELAMVELYSGHLDAAIDHKRAARRFCAAAGDRAGEARALFYIAYIQTAWGRYDAASATYAEALVLAPEVNDLHLDVQHLVGVLEVARGNLIQAASRLRALEDAVLQPRFAAHVRRFYHLHGEILLARGRTEDALRNFAPAIRIYDHPLYREALARAYEQAGRLDAAEAEYRRLIGLRDARLDVPIHYVKAHYALGRLYEVMGRPADAEEMYRRFLAFWGTDATLPSVADARARLAQPRGAARGWGRGDP